MMARAKALLAQGATEYLVLLAVVLIIAIVGIAILGFAPGLASDAKETESRLYWQGASPIAVVEWGARYASQSVGNYTHVYLRVKNTGGYPISITRILVANTSINSVWTSGWAPIVLMSGRITMQPGEENFFGYRAFFSGLPELGAGNRNYFSFSGLDGNPAYNAVNFRGAAASVCQRSQPWGYLVAENFGFEYTATVEGQTVTKRQVGKTLVIRCRDNYD